MTTYADQVERDLALAETAAMQMGPAGRNAVFRAIHEVSAAWNADTSWAGQTILAENCQDMATGRSSWDRWRFGSVCADWWAGVRMALDNLAATLDANGAANVGEAIGALISAGEQLVAQNEVINPSLPEVWQNTPVAVKLLAAVLAARFVLGGLRR